MKVEVDRWAALAHSELARWRALQEAHRELASPFLAPEFASAVAAARGDVFLAQMSHGGQTIGFLPFQRRGPREGLPIAFRISNCQGAIADPAADWDVRALIRCCHLDTWSFDHLVPSVPFEPYFQALRQTAYVDLSNGYSGYARGRREAGSNLLRDLARRVRRLEREVGGVEFTFHDPDPAALRTLMEWKSAQYRAAGLEDRFAFRWVTETVERVYETRDATFGGVLSRLSADGVTVALNLGLRSRTVLDLWFTAYDPRFARFSPGLILLTKIIEEAAELGFTTVELGRSGAAYKQRLMSGERDQAVGRVSVKAVQPAESRRDRIRDAIPSARVQRLLNRLEERREWRSLEPRL